MDERAGDLDALAHALRVRADRPIGGVGQGRPCAIAAGGASASGRLCNFALSRTNSRPVRKARPLRAPARARGAVDGGVSHARLPGDWTVPADGRSRPGEQVQQRVLPAPFGPSSPVTPGPSANETSLTATTLPYQRETWSSAIAGGGSPAAAGAAGSGVAASRRSRRVVTPRSAGSGGWSDADDADRRRRAT